MAEKKKGFKTFSKHAKEVKADLAHAARKPAATKPAARAAVAARRTLRDTAEVAGTAAERGADVAGEAVQKGAETMTEATRRSAGAVEDATTRGADTLKGLADQGAETARRGAAAFGEATRSATAAAQEAMQAGAETARQGAEAAGDTSWRVAERAGSQAAEAGRSALDAASVLTGAAQETTADIQALAKLPSVALGGVQEIRQAWSQWMTRSVENATRATHDIMRCTNLQQMAEVQSSLMKEQVSAMLEGNAEMLRIATRLSQAALRPIEERQQAR
jgi:hypothetical protein